MLLKIKILFILLFFIQSRIAHGINIHYCGNLVVDFSYLHDAEGCDMDNSKSKKNCQVTQKNCCHDKVIVYDKNQLETESKTTSLFDASVDQSFFQYLSILDDYITTTIPELQPPKIPAFKKYCSFVFYG